MKNTPHPIREVLVIGAGPAGSSAAMRLHADGFQVSWVDATQFPRDKVCGCCLNLAALTALAGLDCDRRVRALVPQELNAWHLTASGRSIHAPLPGGLALSRSLFDITLIEEARSRGLELRTGVRAKVVSVTDSEVLVHLSGETDTPRRFDAVILATGLAGGGVANWLPWVVEPHGPMGATVLVDDLAGVAGGTIRMVCGPDGYVGLVRLEDGRVDVAGALRPQRQPHAHSEMVSSTASDAIAPAPSPPRPSAAKLAVLGQINAILRTANLGPLPDSLAGKLMVTPPLRRSRRCGQGRLLAVGDAAGYVEPFTGEGMAWAIRTGIEAASCVAQHRDSQDLGAAWRRRYAELMRSRQWLCRALSQGLQTPRRARLLVGAMSLAPWAVRRAVQRLNRG
jgi:flavin-dependent dehydrogenase